MPAVTLLPEWLRPCHWEGLMLQSLWYFGLEAEGKAEVLLLCSACEGVARPMSLALWGALPAGLPGGWSLQSDSWKIR